jgi:hypothetical protein
VSAAVVAVCLVSLAASLQACGTLDKQAKANSFLLKDDDLAGVHVTPATSYKKVARYLSGIDSSLVKSFPAGGCRLAARKIGLKVGFSDLTASGAGTPVACEFFFAIATSDHWHTANGLRVGNSINTMRRLFPKALNVGKIPGRHWGIPVHSVGWWLDGATESPAHTVLEAYTRDSRVVAIGIGIVGH